MAIGLPKKPDANAYEDLIAAVLLGAGYFTETRITLKDGSTEVLELDCVATPVGAEFPNRRLYEAKSGSCGFGDLFKLYGQMTYLGIRKGAIARMEAIDADRVAAFTRFSDETGAGFCHFGTTSDADVLSPIARPLDEKLMARLVSTAWYSRIAQRVAFSKFLAYCKSSPSDPVKNAKDYQHAIQKAFFARSAIERVHALYDAYKASPKLCGAFVDLLVKPGVNAESIWRANNDTNERPWLQYVCMMEHSARLGIVKNAIDHLIEKASGVAPKMVKFGSLEFSWSDFLAKSAPKAFRDTIDELDKHPYRNHLPYLMQVYIEIFGGFHSIRDDSDLELLAAITGIPAASVPECFDLYNKMFPIGETWFYNQKDEIRVMKMVPGIYRGIGAFLRQTVYGLKTYEERFPKMGWLISRWHNAPYHTLEPILGDGAKKSKVK